MLKKFFKLFVELTGHPVSSRLLQSITKSRGSRVLNRLFIRTYGIKLDEAEKSIKEYNSLQSLFTRKLKPGSRPIDPASNTMVSPVDGVLSVFGRITDTSTFPVKGQEYQLLDLLGNRKNGTHYENGYYFVFYLSPGHYHRIHSPIQGIVIDQWSLGKVSFPVNKLGLKYGDKPFSTNYRLISELETAFGKVAVVKVGALNVNSIHLTHPTAHVKKGEEMGYFSFGSTVILFIEEGNFQISDKLKEEMEINYGRAIGHFNS